MKIVTSEELREEAKYLRLCVYGEPGSGKTWFGASGALDPITAPVLFLEYRSQIASLRSNSEFVKAIDEKRLVIVSLDDYGDLNQLYHWLSRGYGSNEKADALFSEAPKTIVVDSLTELQRSEVMRVAGNSPGSFIRDLDLPEIQDWNALLNQFTLLAHLFYQLPYHIVFIALEAVDYGKHAIGEQPPISGYRLALQGAAQRQFPAYALTLMRLERATGAYADKMHAIGYTYSSVSSTKEQTGMIPPKIGAPTLPKLAKMLLGQGTGEEVE